MCTHIKVLPRIKFILTSCFLCFDLISWQKLFNQSDSSIIFNQSDWRGKKWCYYHLSISDQIWLMLKTSMSWKLVWIYLKSQNKFWNLKIWFKSENELSCLKIYFKCGPRRVVQCGCIQSCHIINLNTCSWHHSAEPMFEINFQTR